MANKLNTSKNMATALGGRRFMHSVRHTESSDALVNAINSQPTLREINIIIKILYMGKGVKKR